MATSTDVTRKRLLNPRDQNDSLKGCRTVIRSRFLVPLKTSRTTLNPYPANDYDGSAIGAHAPNRVPDHAEYACKKTNNERAVPNADEVDGAIPIRTHKSWPKI